MFPYDQQLLALLATPPASVADVLATMQSIDALTIDGDGLKWFNWLYMQVTQQVETQVSSQGLASSTFLAELDVQFAQLYFNALKSFLSNDPLPECWRILFERRNQTALARIQCALAGINAHINHDLPEAIVTTCQMQGFAPKHGATAYASYTSLNTTLDGLIEEAKQALHVRLLGDVLPAAAHLEDTLAAWSVSAARESAWNNAELLWHLRGETLLSNVFLDTVDGLTSVVGQGLLIPIL